MRIFFDLCNPKVPKVHILLPSITILEPWSTFLSTGCQYSDKITRVLGEGRGGAGFNYCSDKILMRFVSHLLGTSKMPRFWSIRVNKGRVQLFPQAMGGEHCKLGLANFSSNMAAVTGKLLFHLQ